MEITSGSGTAGKDIGSEDWNGRAREAVINNCESSQHFTCKSLEYYGPQYGLVIVRSHNLTPCTGSTTHQLKHPDQETHGPTHEAQSARHFIKWTFTNDGAHEEGTSLPLGTLSLVLARCVPNHLYPSIPLQALPLSMQISHVGMLFQKVTASTEMSGVQSKNKTRACAEDYCFPLKPFYRRPSLTSDARKGENNAA